MRCSPCVMLSTSRLRRPPPASRHPSSAASPLRRAQRRGAPGAWLHRCMFPRPPSLVSRRHPSPAVSRPPVSRGALSAFSHNPVADPRCYCSHARLLHAHADETFVTPQCHFHVVSTAIADARRTWALLDSIRCRCCPDCPSREHSPAQPRMATLWAPVRKGNFVGHSHRTHCFARGVFPNGAGPALSRAPSAHTRRRLRADATGHRRHGLCTRNPGRSPLARNARAQERRPG